MLILILKFVHVLCFVYWLGGDLGTFYAARFVRNGALTTPARLVAAKIMLGVDMGPRICMPLILPVGMQLAYLEGLVSCDVSWIAALWLICLIWLCMVLAVHHYQGQRLALVIGRVDFWLRVTLASTLGLLAVAGLAGAGVIEVRWVAFKLLVYAGLIVCGLMIRMHLAPFGPAFARLMANDKDETVNRIISSSIGKCLPWVYFIWFGLLLSAATGMHLLGA